MITYRNYRPIAYRDEKLVPVPGWGMHPILAGSRVIGISGLGMAWEQPPEWTAIVPPVPPLVYRPARPVGIPFMPRTVDGILSTPHYVALGMDIPIKTPVGTQHIDVPIEAIANKAIEAAWPNLQQKLEAESTKILNQAQPRLRSEIDRGLKQARTTGYIIGAAIVASVFAAAWWVKKGK